MASSLPAQCVQNEREGTCDLALVFQDFNQTQAQLCSNSAKDCWEEREVDYETVRSVLGLDNLINQK